MYRFPQKHLLLFIVLAMGYTTCFASQICTLDDLNKRHDNGEISQNQPRELPTNVHTLPTAQERYEQEANTVREITTRLDKVEEDYKSISKTLCAMENRFKKEISLLSQEKHNKQPSKNNYLRKIVLSSPLLVASDIIERKIGSKPAVPFLLLATSGFCIGYFFLRRTHTPAHRSSIRSIADTPSQVVGVIFIGTALLVAAAFSDKIDLSRYGGRKKDLTLQLITLGASMAAGYFIEGRYPYSRRLPFPLPPPSGGDSA